jgi:heme exporter protein A
MGGADDLRWFKTGLRYNQPMIQIENLVKTFSISPVLRGVNLTIEQGEFVTLVGSNGAGKSTLMRIVSTLMRPTSGSVILGGWPLPQQADRVRRYIGLVSHQSLLYGDLSAGENLEFYARLYGLPNREALVESALKRVGLIARQRDPVRTFSRGMVQRLTIARATLHGPDVLLLDEPYTGLDQDASALLDTLLRREHANGRTIFMITHDLARGLDLCDRVVILHRGKIVREVRGNEMDPGAFIGLYRDIVRQ